MAKQESLKDQLKKAAKKRLARNAAIAQTGTASAEGGSDSGKVDALPGGDTPAAGFPTTSRSTATKSLNIIVNALLTLDRRRNDLNDRAVLVGLKSVLRGYAGAEPGAAAVYQAVVEAKQEAAIQPRPLRAAIDELLQIVTAYGSNRETPRAALTYLHSVAS